MTDDKLIYFAQPFIGDMETRGEKDWGNS